MSFSSNWIPSTKNVSLNMLDYPDCIFLTEHARCERLSVAKCMGNTCSFALNEKDDSKGKQNWAHRLSLLSDDEQQKIADKYYGGHILWRVDAEKGK